MNKDNTKDSKKIQDKKVLFILGNGFDLKLNMKTRYRDVYDGYIKELSKSDNISKFKAELSENGHYEKWSDFEMGLAEYAKTLSSEDELIECLRDFKLYMMSYLKKENAEFESILQSNKMVVENAKEMLRSLKSFYLGMTKNTERIIEKLIDEDLLETNFLIFNYTYSFEILQKVTKGYFSVRLNEPLHIHGELNGDIIVGLDNKTQIKPEKYTLSYKGERAIIKTILNENYDSERVENAKKMIAESSVICIYGFSMGETDKIWVDLITDWLLCNPHHHLVVFQYDENTYNTCNFDELMDFEDERKIKLINRLGIIADQVFNQIHIPIGYDIFNFSLQEVVEEKDLVEV